MKRKITSHEKLVQAEREAREHGMTYGQYQAEQLRVRQEKERRERKEREALEKALAKMREL
jgi:hypothetical protein